MSNDTTYQVQFWKLRETKGRRRPWGVRWVTAGREHSESYATKALAESFRAELVRAARAGEAFDITTGLPLSVLRRRGSRTLLDLAVSYIDHRWPSSPPNTREYEITTLAAIIPAFVLDLDHAPPASELQTLLTTQVLPPPRRKEPVEAEQKAALGWLRRASRPVTDLAKPLEATRLLERLKVSPRGRPIAPGTWDTRRALLHQLAGYGVDLGVLVSNPLSGARVRIGQKATGIDPRVVVNPVQARQLLAAVTYVTAANPTFGERGERLHAFFACMYYAGLRPGEASYLRREDCTLPDAGWGELLLSGSMAKAKKGYIDGIDDPYRRPLKRRRRGDVRVVPAAPALVAILREHLERYGTADDGRLFPAPKTGGPMDAEVYCRVWREARKIGLSPELVATPLAARPYDLRHAALSSWLNAGVPPSEVAARAGHSVAVLLSVYAKCLDGQRDTFNARIQDLLDPGA